MQIGVFPKISVTTITCFLWVTIQNPKVLGLLQEKTRKPQMYMFEKLKTDGAKLLLIVFMLFNESSNSFSSYFNSSVSSAKNGPNAW